MHEIIYLFILFECMDECMQPFFSFSFTFCLNENACMNA